MLKGEIKIDYEIIPDAFIIDRLSEQNFDIYNQTELRLPESNPADEIIPKPIKDSPVIIISLFEYTS